MADIVPTSVPVPARGLADIPGLKQVGLLAGVAAAIAAAIWLVLWSQGQNYSVLYGQLSERESGQVMDALTAAGIEFKLSPSGAVSVPETKVQEARIRLASQGLPQSDSMGIEMIQKDSALGNSTLMESARYQSVLETELARTIIKVQGVQSVRVHLALPKPSVFLRDAHKATASVMLQLYPGRRLDPGQVAAIVHLVASSVPELSANDVTLVDQAGSLLNSPDENAEAAATTRHFEQTRKLEESYQQRIIELLEPMLGAGRVRVQVRVRAVGMRVPMGVEGSAAPADEQPDGEAGDQEPDRGLGAALDGLREVRAVEDDRDAEREERQCVPRAPRQAEPGRVASPALRRGEQRRDSREMVGVGGVAQTEQDGHGDHEHDCGAVRGRGEIVVEPEHGQLTFGMARTVIAAPAMTIISRIGRDRGRVLIGPPTRAGRAWPPSHGPGNASTVPASQAGWRRGRTRITRCSPRSSFAPAWRVSAARRLRRHCR